jgi:hypothetical protein
MARGSGGRRQGARQCIRRYAARVAQSSAAGALALMTACGGQAFVLSDASSPGDASTGDASTGPETGPAIDASPVTPLDAAASPNLACFAPCQVGSTCCIATNENGHCTQGTGACSPCETRLHCTSDLNCTGGQACCVVSMANTDTCSNGQPFVSQCQATACAAGQARLCDPSGVPCPAAALRKCSTSGSDLQPWNLPTNQGYGVCVTAL